jgi:single-strand DNA-binding protein
MNQIWLQGRLASDPEGGESGNGVSYATFSVAIERGSGESKTTIFLDCVTFRQPADFVKGYLHKGDSVNVIGAVNVRDWEDSNGIKRRKFEVVASQISFPVSGKGRGGNSKPAPRNGGDTARAGAAPAPYDDS